MNKHNMLIKRVDEYIKKLTEINRKIKKDDNFRFSDGTIMYYWKYYNDNILINEYKNNIIPDNERLEEIMCFAKIYDVYYMFNKNSGEVYENRVIEYFIKVLELQRNIEVSDKIKFMDNSNMDMSVWYKNEIERLVYERKNNIIPDKKRMEDIVLFASLEKVIYEVNNKNYNNYLKRVNEYIEQIKKLKSNITSDDVLFSDGRSMKDWYTYENNKIDYELSNNIDYNQDRIYELMLFAKIYDEIYNQKKLSLLTKEF